MEKLNIAEKSSRKAISLAVVACLIYTVSAGIRSSYGVLLGVITEKMGFAYSDVSFVLAVGQIVFGIVQPLFGMLALRKSYRFVMGCGICLTFFGAVFLPFCAQQWMLMAFLGVILPCGTGALSFGIIMGAVTPRFGERYASLVSGCVNASSGIGSAVFAPLVQSLTASWGLAGTMFLMGTLVLLLVPLVWWINRDGGRCVQAGTLGENGAAGELEHTGKGLFLESLKNRSYRLLLASYCTCGFHMAITETHLYSQFVSYEITEAAAAYAITVYGITRMAGSVLSGILCQRFCQKNVLSCLYGARVGIAVLFLLLPKTVWGIFAFAACLGLTSSATTIPTSGLISRIFGSARLAVLFGLAGVCHQIGSFFGTWLGGVTVSATGEYLVIWGINIVLCFLAAVWSFRIKE